MILRIALGLTRFVLILALLVAFYLLWCGLMVQGAIDAGAIKNAKSLCIDARHLHEIERGRVSDKTVNYVLRWAILDQKAPTGHVTERPRLILNSAGIGFPIFWSSQDRHRIYKQIEPRMRLCPSAAERLRELQAKGRLLE